MCGECYVTSSRVTPLLHPLDCLEHHKQYICGMCGRCICIECDKKRSLQRWNFPFKSLEIATLYLRTADYTMKKSCGIYEIKGKNGRISYKIFAKEEDLKEYLKKNKDKSCETMKPSFQMQKYKEFPNTEVRRLDSNEIQRYLAQR